MVELADSLDSGSSVHYARAGSSPASRTKKKDICFQQMSFFFYSAAKRIEILGRSEFTLRQNARTAQMRRRPEGRFAGSLVAVSIIENIDFNRPLQKRHDVCRVFFYPSGDSEPRWPLVEAQVMSQARQIGENQGQFLGLSNFLWYGILP